MDWKEIALALLAVLMAGGGYWLRGVDERVKKLEDERGDMKALRELVERHVEHEENVLWKKLAEMDTQANARHTEVVQRLTAVETTLKGGSR